MLIRHYFFICCYKMYMVNKMKVKIIDESHEKDLERSVNAFLESTQNEIIEIQFKTAVSIFGEEQVYCFSAMIVYQEKS